MTDPLTDILRLGASAEVADCWIALSKWVEAHPTRPPDPTTADLLRCYYAAIGAHERAERMLAEYIQNKCPKCGMEYSGTDCPSCNPTGRDR